MHPIQRPLFSGNPLQPTAALISQLIAAQSQHHGGAIFVPLPQQRHGLPVASTSSSPSFDLLSPDSPRLNQNHDTPPENDPPVPSANALGKKRTRSEAGTPGEEGQQTNNAKRQARWRARQQEKAALKEAEFERLQSREKELMDQVDRLEQGAKIMMSHLRQADLKIEELDSHCRTCPVLHPPQAPTPAEIQASLAELPSPPPHLTQPLAALHFSQAQLLNFAAARANEPVRSPLITNQHEYHPLQPSLQPGLPTHRPVLQRFNSAASFLSHQ